MSDVFWKRAAQVLSGLLCLVLSYFILWPRLQAGQAAIAYLNLCVAAKVCPTADQLQERLSPPKAADPAPTPPTSAPSKGK